MQVIGFQLERENEMAATAGDKGRPETIVLINGFWLTALSCIAGGNDHTVPASVTEANYKLFKKSSAVTDFPEFPGGKHWMIGQPGWEKAADYALDWALKSAR